MNNKCLKYKLWDYTSIKFMNNKKVSKVSKVSKVAQVSQVAKVEKINGIKRVKKVAKLNEEDSFDQIDNNNNSDKTLVIVESPGKIKKIQEILGSKYIVAATYGHIIDLDESLMSINFDTFEPNYKPISKPKNMTSAVKIINNIKTLYKKYKKILIATDNDREGEMIAWSVEYILGISSAPRIIFNSITKEALLKAIEDVNMVNISIVDAQKTRRILDRIIGYKLSPLLFAKFGQYNLSAGRVQSVVTKIIVDLEEKINSFFNDQKENKPCDYKIKSSFNKDNIIAWLHEKKNKTKQNSNGSIWIGSRDTVNDIIEKAKTSNYKISNISEKKHVQQPQPPYTTCSLQQDASKIGLSIKQCMDIAQKLYEGGYITYMRTDSIKLSKECEENIKDYVCEKYSDKYYSLNNYNAKEDALSQEAHEAIRPIKISLTNLDGLFDVYTNKLYKLIWKRTVMSQMSSATYNETLYQISISNIDLQCVQNLFPQLNMR